MKAFGFKEHGDRSVMQFFETSKPIPKKNEVLIELKASAFNHLDIWVRYGWPGLNLQLPHISGSDGAGVIVEIGSEIKEFTVGDRVAIYPGVNPIEDEFTLTGQHSVSPYYQIRGEQISGTHCQFIAVPAEHIIKIPEHFSFEDAAAAGLVSITAYRMLIHRAQIKAGESVLILGAGGGVNSVAIQLAKYCGCNVYTITSGPEKVAKAKALGADVVIDYQNDAHWSKNLHQLSGKRGFDVIVDNVGQKTLNESLKLVKFGGRIVIVGNTSGPHFNLDIRYLFAKQISLIGSTMGNLYDYNQVMNLHFLGKIKPVIYEVFPFERAQHAMELLENGQQFGKLVLKY